MLLNNSFSIMTNSESKAQKTAQSVTPGFASKQPVANPHRAQKAHSSNSTYKHPSTPGNPTAGSSSFGGSVPPAGKPPSGNSGNLPELPGGERRNPYIWPSWLAKLIAGEAQCTFQYWLKANYKYQKLPSTFAEQYKIDHNSLLQDQAQQFLSGGSQVRKEDQNSFTIRGKTATIGGKPDIIALGVDNTIGECKSGKHKKGSDVAQLKIYMYLAPMAKLHGMTTTPNGLLIYQDEVFEIPASEIEDSFKQLVRDEIAMLTSPEPPAKAPSARECRFCDVPIDICPARLESSCDVETDLF